MRHYRLESSKYGFVLLEVAIAICVIGIICGTIAKNVEIKKNIYEARTTKENINVIKHALADFVAINCRLPSPSELQTSGEEGEYGNTYGYIPFKALGIDKKHTKSGNGKALYYAVEPELTDRNISRIHQKLDLDVYSGNCFCKNYEPKIFLTSSAIDIVDQNSKIAYVLTDAEPTIISNICSIETTKNTFWVTRGVILSKYLKTKPCISSDSVDTEFVQDDPRLKDLLF